MSASQEQSGANQPELSPYTTDHAAQSLKRAVWIVITLTVLGLPFTWTRYGWQTALLLLVGSVISATGLWEWKRLMTALMARMDAQDAEMAAAGEPISADPDADVKRPSIAFAITGFIVRFVLVMVVLYVSLKYLHGSVLALAAGLAMGVFGLTVEGIRLLRSGTI